MGGNSDTIANQAELPAAAGLLVAMTRRLSSEAGMPRAVVSVAVYLAQLAVIEGIVARAQTRPLPLSSDTVSGPANPVPALAKNDR